MVDVPAALAQLEAAVAAKKLSPKAADNIRTWLTEPYLAEYAPQVAEHLAAGKWRELEEAFWTTIPFGTGGRRGWMYPIGCNAINDRTIGESAQGLADYVKSGKGDKSNLCEAGHRPEVGRGPFRQIGPVPFSVPGRPLGCAVAYDTRHGSRHFAELCGEIMAAAGFVVYFLDGYRSTPELSFAVRYKRCDCGIIITASHNPPRDNAVKVYGSTGGQLLPPHDQQSIERMQQVKRIHRLPFAEGLRSGKIVYCQDEVDPAYVKAVLAQSVPGPRTLKIIYSPLHGVGASAVCPVLAGAGFEQVEVFGPHAAPDPDFSNVPNHVANPENAAVFGAIIERARQVGADLIMATDPDADRLGSAALTSAAPGAAWATLTGNQIGSLLTDFLLGVRQAAGSLTPEHYVVKTLVTTELMRRIADRYGAQTAGNLLVGFKYIAGEIDERGPEKFVFGAEESYGFLAGDHVRDKDGAVAAMLLAELAARLKAEGRTLNEKLDDLFRQHGCYTERQFSVEMPGEKGMESMQALLAGFRSRPPLDLGGMKTVRVRDYLSGASKYIAGRTEPLDGPEGDLLIFDLAAPGNYVAVRPSGTEPKIKFYMFAYDPPEASTNLQATKAAQAQRLKAVEKDLRAASGT